MYISYLCSFATHCHNRRDFYEQNLFVVTENNLIFETKLEGKSYLPYLLDLLSVPIEAEQLSISDLEL